MSCIATQHDDGGETRLIGGARVSKADLRTELILTDSGAQRKCEACGNTFSCGASLKGCWCSQVELTAEVREKLREGYRDCLCPECLTKIAGGHIPDASHNARGEND